MTDMDNTNQSDFVSKTDPRNGIELKATPIATDGVPLIDSENGNILKYMRYSSILNAKVLINTTLVASAQNVDLTGFSSQCCMLLFNLRNDNAGGATYSVYVNGDTTAGNYHRNGISYVNGGAPVGGEGSNSILEGPVGTTDTLMGRVILMTGPGYLMMDASAHVVNDIANHGSRLQNILYHASNPTAITSVRLASSVADGVGNGTQIRLLELG